MTKLEIIEKIKVCEENLIRFKEHLNSLESNYFQYGKIRLDIETKDLKYPGSSFYTDFSPELMKDYLRHEIDLLNKKSKENINMLNNFKC